MLGISKEVVDEDKILQMLNTQVEAGFPNNRKLLREELREFWRHRGTSVLCLGAPCTD